MKLTQCIGSLFDLLLQPVKLRRREKLAESDVQAVADHLDRQQLGILTFPVKDILDARRRQSAYR